MENDLKKIIGVTISTIALVPAVIMGKATFGDYKKDVSSYNDNEKSISSQDNDVLTTNNATEAIYVVPTETVVITTEPTTVEIIDEFKDIRFLENLKNNDLSIDELFKFIIRYCEFSKLSYETGLDVIKNNVQSIENDYQSIRGGIMCTLFDYSTQNGLLSPYTNDREIREEMTQEEKESTLIEFSDNLCLSSEDKYIVLAAFREETGNGTSRKCVYDNNYGGIRVYGEAGCNGQYGMYSTPEYGMFRQVKLISKKLNDIHSNGTYDLNSVVYSFASRYNPEHASTYSSKIMNWVNKVQNDYGDFSNLNYEKVYTIK